MTKEELIKQARRIIDSLDEDLYGALAESQEFLRTYGGKDNSFLNQIKGIRVSATDYYKYELIKSSLNSFIRYVEQGLLRAVSLEREIQIETVSDYLEQADILLINSKVHPAAPAVIIGASLEEFLRNWLEEEGVDFSKLKMNLDSYSKELKSMELISKQDLKDLTSWGGIRNDAAHGHWDNVEDRKRIQLMLEGVNLFIRKYSK